MPARALMLQGTGSSVGKSLLLAGLARALFRRGLNVRPFKPQNMANNAAVSIEGGEISRAQALQARAAGVAPSVHMNPVLLKPESERGSQIIVHGRVFGKATAREYQWLKPQLLPKVLESFQILAAASDLVLVEGAGSAAEVNLRAHDIANMGFARAAGVPVVLIGDIDRGGVIASLIGTQAVLAEDDAACIKGFIVNRLRGDAALFAEGMRFIAARTGWAPLGLVPYFPPARKLPAEDTAELKEERPKSAGRLRIAVPLLPHIANFDDLDPLRLEPEVNLLLVPRGKPLPADADLVLLLGSKSVRSDLAVFRNEGWDIDLLAYHRRGSGLILGICGGLQMLGRTIADPEGLEGAPGTSEGLGLLDIETVFRRSKHLREVSGTNILDGSPVQGYEIHLGESFGPDMARPLHLLSDGRREGAISADGRVMGTYLHGLFTHDRAR
ncbi:MAG: cobyric acid synthase, partial [Acetobacteraceae bacterium]|nr:cobyric acid synthase [Acetobacteraceae bacterium]